MNNYMFIRVVGKGSYGEVNLVKHKTDRKQYVIKKLNLTTSSKRERRAAEQEAQLLSRLRHPNIVTYRESWEGEDCQLYIAMGFCEGGDLYHRLKQQKGELLPERQVVEWFVQIAMALQYLHEEHILHRDLKTQNIFLTKTNIIKVGDLGIARVLENQNDMANTLIGTPYYMSPELFSNKPYNHKSDVWALGCCVYEMSTLKHAFNAKDMNSLVYRIVEGKLPQMPSKYDPQLGALIKSMLCKRPEDRPDVKLILRQPYIKRQIAMFLEATKEKTAKSRKKAVGGSLRPNSAASVVSSQPGPECPPQCPQPDPNTRGKRKEEINTQEHKGRNGITQDTPPQTHLTTKSPTQDILNTTGVSLATISKIDIDLQTQEETNTQRGDPPQTVSNARADNDTLCQSSVEEQMGGNPDPPPSLPHPRRLLSSVSTREEESKTTNGPVMQGVPKTRDRVRTSVEKTVNTDDKDDTMELLKDVVIESPATGHSICLDVSTNFSELRSAGQLKVESTGQTFEVNIENKDDTRNLLKEVPAHKHTAVVKESLVSTEKLLEPLPPVAPCHLEPLPPVPEQDTPPLCTPSSSEPSVSCQRRQRDRGRIQSDQDKWNKVAAPRPLPPPPINALVVEVKKRSRTNTDKKRATTTTSVKTISSSKDGNTPLPQQERPLTARERRRLRQSQQNPSQPIVNAERRASYDVASLHNKQPESQNSTVTRSVSEMGKETNQQDRFLGRPSDEDECSSSTSSTDHSEGDCKEGKSESSDMQDLVQMMTQTLRMDGRDTVSELDGVRSTPLAEFKLNRKYRDTLMLHGKAREEQEFHFSELSTGTTSGPAKIRRAIEHLKTDVVKGLGVKLLDRVLDIMEDDDEDKRELCLRKQMGDDKYQSYALMVRQLKFFEDVSFKG
ncbi:serine/threonine-protein kinase Nek4 isoform X1 [Oncorhynchus kisutch]|uniref:serine/threonine-protein kinase Nek4 isoform X1 n=1 Tax=Oncorhynchus kisutch TaxID=8019 RepID=UPI00099FE787|nr:serine/threonine-protein kinase Nek4 isoform X1 [Oncorhynchus kisutch]